MAVSKTVHQPPVLTLIEGSVLSCPLCVFCSEVALDYVVESFLRADVLHVGFPLPSGELKNYKLRSF